MADPVLTPVDRLQQAGFSDQEIGQWSTQQRANLGAAGFSDNEISDWLQGPKPGVPQSFLDRVNRGLGLNGLFDRIGKAEHDTLKDVATAPAISPEGEQQLRDIGIFNDPSKGQSSPIRTLNEAIIRPVAAAYQMAGGVVNAGIAGIAAGAGGLADLLTTGSAEAQTEKPGAEKPGASVERETANLLNFVGAETMARGFGTHLTRPEIAPDGTVHDTQIGGLPEREDFGHSAQAIFGKASPEARAKIEALWDDHGIHPSEVAHDAQTDPTIAQDLASTGTELPQHYVDADRQPPPRVSAEPETAEPPQTPAPTFGVPEVQSFAPAELSLDPERFQFKAATDQAGVSSRLQGVTNWDPIKAGLGIVWQDDRGANWIADGHQRLGLAQRIAAADPTQQPRLNAWVLKASDGVSDTDARAVAAAKNIAEGTGSPVDAAKVLRDRPDLLPSLPPRSELVRQAQGLMNLDDNAFGKVVNEVVPANYAAIVGRLAPDDPAMQNASIDLLAKTQPENAVQAESIVRQAMNAGLHTETQTSLFGNEDVATSLYLERAKILDRSIKQLRRDRTVFNSLVDNSAIIEELGNQLAQDENARRAVTDGQAVQILQAVANRRGPLSDALSAGARAVADGSADRAAVTRDFVAEVRRQAESGALLGFANGGSAGDLAAAVTGGGVRPSVTEPGSAVERNAPDVAPAQEAKATAQTQWAVRAYHGTPHTFEPEAGAPLGRFDLEKIGSGEGAQSYGHGIYLAQAPEVAQNYRSTLADREFTKIVRETYDEHDHPEDALQSLLADRDLSAPQRELLAALQKDGWLGFDYPHQAVSAVLREPENFDLSPAVEHALGNLGSLYETHIKAPVDSFLDWDKPLADQPGIVEKLKAAGIPTGDLKRTGEELHDELLHYDTAVDEKSGRPDQAALAKRLSDAGIRGVRYLDQNSRVPARMAPIDAESLRGSIKAAEDSIRAIHEEVENNQTNSQLLPAYFERAKEDIAERETRIAQWRERLADIESGKNITRNFVVFDPKDIEITGRNGESLAAEQKPAIEQTDQGSQLVLPGAERSAQQAMEAREAEGRGKIAPQAPQQPPEGLFAPKEPEQPSLWGSESGAVRNPFYQPPRTSAEQAVLDHISIGETHDTRPWSWSRLYSAAIDRLFPIAQATAKAVGEGTRSALGGVKEVPTAENPYQLARLMSGVAGKADNFINDATRDWATYERNGASLRSVLAPVKEDLNGFRAFAAAVRALELERRGIETGFDMAAAREVASSGIDRYADTFDQLVQYQDRVAGYLRDSGVLNRDGYEAMREANRLYVPFNRVFTDEDVAGGVGPSLQARNPIQRIKGSERQIVDPIESIVRNTYLYTAMAEKNAVGTALVDLLREQGEAHGAIGDISQTHWRDAVARPAAELDGHPVIDVDGSVLPPAHPAQPDMFPERGPVPTEAPREIGPGVTALPADVSDAIREALHAQGLGDELFDFMAQSVTPAEGEIAIFRDGRREVWQVDPELARAFKALDRESTNSIIKLLAAPASWLRAGAVLNPDFQIRHTFRDYLYAGVTSARGFFSPVDMARGFIGLIGKDDDFRDWLASGGSNISRVALDRRYLQENLRKLNAQTGLMARAWNVIADPAELWQAKVGEVSALPFRAANHYILGPLRYVTELAENASHLGAFKKAMRQIEGEMPEGEEPGKPEIQQAGFESRDLAVDAARVGGAMKSYNMITAFANITLQDSDRVARAFIEKPLSTALKIGAFVVAPSAMLWWLNHDDPDYWEIPQWERDLFWVIPAGSGQNKVFFRLPKPWGMGVLFGSGTERALQEFATDRPDAFRELGKSLADTVVPQFYPTATAPMLDQFANRSAFTNRTLIPSQLESQLPEYQYTPYTSPAARKLSSLIAAFPGMRQESLNQNSPLMGGVARALTTPILLENYIRAWSGNLGMYALDLVDEEIRRHGGVAEPPRPTDTLADIPVVKAFAVRYPSASAESIQRFYDDYQTNQSYLTTWKAQAEAGDADAANRIAQLGGPRIFAQLQGAYKALGEHSKLIRDIWADEGMQPTEKRQLIDQLYFSEIQIAQAARKQMAAIDQTLGASPPVH